MQQPALGALALLSREEADVRLSALAGAPLYRLTQLLQDTQLAPELRKSAASTLGNLARSPSTRCVRLRSSPPSLFSIPISTHVFKMHEHALTVRRRKPR